MKNLIVVGALVLAVGCGVACTPPPSGHEASFLACSHARNIAGDIQSGILTDAELRSKLKEVHDDSAGASYDVQTAATAMLAAATSGSTGDMGIAMADMNSACSATGN
jgi:hypothetical protein